MSFITGTLRKNRVGRWCIVDSSSRKDLVTLNSRAVFEILEDGEWKLTRMEHSDNDYISIDGYTLVKDKEVRIEDSDS